MRALRLDYCATPRAPRLGTGMLLLGVLLATLSVIEYRAVRQELAAHEESAAGVRKAGKRAAAAEPRGEQASAAEFRAAQLTLQRLALPWNDLFASLESARVDGVALLAVEPDPARNVVKLRAQARSADEMLRYVERLQSTGALGEATLARHQVDAGKTPEPLRFDIVAAWTK